MWHLYWPQILWVAFAAMATAINIVKHGQAIDGKHSMWVTLTRVAISVMLLSAGGFFDAHAQVPSAAARYRADLTRSAHSQWGLAAPVASFAGQVHQESGWNPEAVSQVGALGLTQFMPSTAAWWCGLQGQAPAECQPRNPTWALRSLVGYDKWLFDRVTASDECNRMAFALSAYNGGLGWIARDKKLAISKGLNALVWFDQVERVNAGRSTANWRENRDYPHRILRKNELLYVNAGWGRGACA